MNTVYNIINRFVVDDRATRAVNRMASSFAGFNGMIARSQSLLGTLITTGGTLGAVMVITQLKRSLIDYNSQLEQAKVSLGAIFSAAMRYKDPISGTWLKGMARFNAAFGEASQLLWKFQKDSARSVGTLKDYIDISRQIADPIMRMGKNTEDLRKFTNQAINAASVLGVDYPQAARDMMSSLTGVAGIDVKLYRLLGSPGGGAKKFNALAPQERYDLLFKAMERYASAASAFEKTHKGLTSTLTDYAKIYLSFAGRPLFVTWKSNLEQLLEFVKKNEEAMRKWSETIGNKLAKAFQILINGIKYLIDHRKDIATLFSIYLGTRIAKGLMGVNTMGGMYQKVGGFVDRAGEARQVAKAGYPNLAFMAMYPRLGGIWKGLMSLGSAGGVSTALSKLGAGLLKFGKVSLIILAVIAVISGVIEAFRTNTFKSRDAIIKAINKIANTIYLLIGTPNSPGAILWGWFKSLLKILGGGLLHLLAGFINGLDLLGKTLNRISYAIAGIVFYFQQGFAKNDFKKGGIGKVLDGMMGALRGGWDAALWYEKMHPPKDFIGDWSKGWKGWKDDVSDLFGVPDEVANPQNNTIINGGVHIYQEYKENMEPDRIAYATVELLNKLTRKPVQPKRSIVYA